MASWSELFREATGGLKRRLGFVLGFVALLWLLEGLDSLLLGSFDAFGIRPRRTDGLIGIPLAPFLHGGFPHLIANTLGLVPLGFLVSARRFWHLPFVTVFVTLGAGLLVWFFGAPSVHIGASGVVFGYLGFLLLAGWFERSLGAVVLSVVVGLAFGGALAGMLPGQPGVSWESHLFGFLAGALAARVVAKRGLVRG